MNKHIPNILRLFSYTLFFSGIIVNWGNTSVLHAQEAYKEYLTFHIGRSTYIAGEQLFYKVYCKSNNEDNVFFSKVLYIELIDRNKESVLTQVLQVENSVASAVMLLPDTLSTGIYNLKAYTHWMRNFNEQLFASEPIFVYNQYYEDNLQLSDEYEIPFEPKVYIQGGKLITDLPACLRIKVPGLFGEKLEVVLHESYPERIIDTITITGKGQTEFSFTPKIGKKYYLVVPDTIKGSITYELPPVEYSGYSLNAFLTDRETLVITTDGSNTPPEQLKLKLITHGSILWEKSIYSEYFNKEINTQYSPGYGYYTIQLTDNRDKILIHQPIFIYSANPIIRTDGIFSTREEVTIKFNLSGLLMDEAMGLSVSIHKNLLDSSQNLVPDESMINRMSASKKDRELQQLYPIYDPKSKQFDANNAIYVAEDMGMLFTGQVINSVGTSALNNFQLVLAFTDTLGVMIAAPTDSAGRFSMLLNETGNKEAYFLLFLDGIPLRGENHIQVDNKFHYSSIAHHNQNEIFKQYDYTFVHEMQNEAQRVLIQKAFGNYNNRFIVSPVDTSVSIDRFYGEPDIVVYPGEFFFLPNFEEIAREILPRVRYKHTKDKCELMIYDIEDDLRSTYPIVLVDGIYITDHRELYELNSDDIQRIEIQSGLHVSGQLLYNGLLAIYTTNKYKREKIKKNGRTTYIIPGFVNNNNKYLIDPGVWSGQTTRPDFANQLYWNPMVLPNQNGMAEFSFVTSDEEGEYIIDIMGFTSDAIPVRYQKSFIVTVSD